MWVYDKKTQYPIHITRPDPRMARLILTQYGGPNGELGASVRYLSQRFAMPNKESKAILTDIGVSLSKRRILNTARSLSNLSVIYRTSIITFIEKPYFY